MLSSERLAILKPSKLAVASAVEYTFISGSVFPSRPTRARCPRSLPSVLPAFATPRGMRACNGKRLARSKNRQDALLSLSFQLICRCALPDTKSSAYKKTRCTGDDRPYAGARIACSLLLATSSRAGGYPRWQRLRLEQQSLPRWYNLSPQATTVRDKSKFEHTACLVRSTLWFDRLL